MARGFSAGSKLFFYRLLHLLPDTGLLFCSRHSSSKLVVGVYLSVYRINSKFVMSHFVEE